MQDDIPNTTTELTYVLLSLARVQADVALAGVISGEALSIAQLGFTRRVLCHMPYRPLWERPQHCI